MNEVSQSTASIRALASPRGFTLLLVNKLRCFCGVIALAVATFGGATAAAFGTTHPALAAAALAKVQSVVTCATGEFSNTGCVNGNNTSSGPGVYGTSSFGTGVSGRSPNNSGVTGSSNAYYGVHGASTANDGILGETSSATKSGVVGSSPGGDGVFGHTTAIAGNFFGVYGLSESTAGVFGTTYHAGIGVLGDNPSQGFGVWGRSRDRGDGVVATSSGSGGTGLYASGTWAIRGNGLVQTSNTDFNGTAADFTGANIGVIGRAPLAGWPLVLTDSADKTVFSVDGAGNVYYSGAFINFARMAGGSQARAFSPKTTLPTVEDMGTAQLVGGSGVVRLDPVFAASIDRSSPYRVFLTPNGDTRGLFVAEKTANGFGVRESQGGRATVTFDYRIVATALGQAGQRMAVSNVASAMPRAVRPVMPAVKLPAMPVAPARGSAP